MVAYDYVDETLLGDKDRLHRRRHMFREATRQPPAGSPSIDDCRTTDSVIVWRLPIIAD